MSEGEAGASDVGSEQSNMDTETSPAMVSLAVDTEWRRLCFLCQAPDISLSSILFCL